MNIDFLFRNTKVSNEDKETLAARFNSRMELAVEEAVNPFESNCFIDGEATKVTLEGFPSGGYASKEQATIAVSLWKVKPSMTYAELYQLSQFILNGLG
jgi:hypothetical protein